METTIILSHTRVGNDTHNTIHNNETQHMTSLEIAELTGKQHKHVMEAVRKMEPAWVKTCGSNFRLTSRTIVQPNGGTREVPCYSLTKTECLYIATKFNDEARAKLVLRAGRGDGDSGKRDRLAGLLRDAPRLGAAEGVGPTPSRAGGE